MITLIGPISVFDWFSSIKCLSQWPLSCYRDRRQFDKSGKAKRILRSFDEISYCQSICRAQCQLPRFVMSPSCARVILHSLYHIHLIKYLCYTPTKSIEWVFLKSFTDPPLILIDCLAHILLQIRPALISQCSCFHRSLSIVNVFETMVLLFKSSCIKHT